MPWRLMMVGLAACSSVVSGQQRFSQPQQQLPQPQPRNTRQQQQLQQQLSRSSQQLDRSFPPVYYLTSAQESTVGYNNPAASALPGYPPAAVASPSSYAPQPPLPPRKKRFFWDSFFRPRPRVPTKTYASTVGAAQRAVYKLRGPNGVWP